MVQTNRPSSQYWGGAHKVNRYLAKTLQVIWAEKWGPGWVLSGKSIASSKPFLVSHTAHIFKVLKHVSFLDQETHFISLNPMLSQTYFSWEFLFISYRHAEKSWTPPCCFSSAKRLLSALRAALGPYSTPCKEKSSEIQKGEIPLA